MTDTQDIFVTGLRNAHAMENQALSIMRPQLTTIRQPCAEIAAVAFRALLDRIADPRLPPREILLSSELVVRPSTRKQHAGGRGRIDRLKPPA